MRYLIAHLIPGEVSVWHNELMREISDKFGTWKIYEQLPPHITIYRPVEMDDIRSVEKLIHDWLREVKALGDITMAGFDRFDDRVVFAKTEVSKSTMNRVLDLRNKIKNLPNVLVEDSVDWSPHATLAYKLTPPEINKIWDYVMTKEKPNFYFPFNNITILRYGKNKWDVEKTFLI